MHELSVCNALLLQVERIAREQDANVVTAIFLKLGPLSGIEPQLLRHAYPLAAAGTVAERAELTIETCDVVVRCTRCAYESQVPANHLLCKNCGDYRTQVISGEDMVLQRVELKRANPERAASSGDQRL